MGMIADFHARALTEVAGAKLVAVAGRSAEKTRAFAGRHGVPYWTTSVDELVARPEVHVVCIATPSGAHLEPALAAVRAGRHVVVEKPLEVTLERTDELLRAAETAGVRVAAIFQARFGPGARAVKSAIDAGSFGRLVLCSAYVKWQRTPEYYRDSWHGTRLLDGGGALMNQGIHAVDLLQWFAGMPQQVHGFTTRRVHQGIEVEDTACAALRFGHGALGVIEASTAVYPGWQRCLEICGENGSVRLEDDQVARWDFRTPPPDGDIRRAASDAASLGSGAAAPNAISHHGHRLQLQDLVEALRHDRAPAVDGRDARNAVAIIRAIYASAERGVPVSL